MTTIDPSINASATTYHDALVKAIRSVIYASRSLKSKVKTQHQNNKGLASSITFLSTLEGAVLKQVQTVSPSPAGLEVATTLLIGYQAFTGDDYEHIYKLGQPAASQQIQHLKDAFKKLSEEIIETEKFIGAQKTAAMGQTPPPESASSSDGSSSKVLTVPMTIVPVGPKKQPAIPLIIQLLQATDLTDKVRIVSVTTSLLDDKTPNPPLQNNEIDPLIKAWRDAVDIFTNDFPPDTPPQLGMLIGLTILHSQLEVLYDQLINLEEGVRVTAATLLSTR